MAGDIFLSSLKDVIATIGGIQYTWEADFPVIGEPGWYMHSGRMYIQGAIDLAPVDNTDLSLAEELSLEGGGAEEDLTVSGVLIRVPAQYGPRSDDPIMLLMDPYWTTPSYMKLRPEATWTAPKPGTPFWELELPPTLAPKGKYGMMRLILSCWWDTPLAASPGAGANDDFDAVGDFSDIPVAGIASKGSRVWLSGSLDTIDEIGDEEVEPGAPEVLLHTSSPVGPHMLMRSLSAGGPLFPTGHPAKPSLDYPDGYGYTVGAASGQGPVNIHVLRERDQLAAGVLPTDRYTFYDVRPVPPDSKPQLGSYTAPGIANPNDDPAGVVGLSGPTSGKGMSLFVGDVAKLVKSSEKPLSLYLCVPPGSGGAGQGYYRFDLFNLLHPTFNNLVWINPFAFYNISPIPTAYNPDWEVDHEIAVPAYAGPKVVFNTVNWAPPGSGGFLGMEAPFYFQHYDVTGNGHKYEPGSGWGWFPIPTGQKSVLITVTTDKTEVALLKAQYEARTGKPVPAGVTTFIIFEWGEVGRLPYESREKGIEILYDPTPILDLDYPIRPFPVAHGGAAESFEIGWIFTRSAKELEQWGREHAEYEAEYESYLLEFEAKRPPGIIPPYGDAAIRLDGSEGHTIVNGVPIWVGSNPLPPWNTMHPGESLDLTNAGYGALAEPGEISIGPGRLGIVPKN